MPIPNIEQPQIIEITELIRLRKYDGNYQVAMEWYQDKETLMLVNGNDKLYDLEKLKCMYEYLNAHGEEYFIEVKEKGHFIPIGDVTLSKDDMPIVIGDKNYRGRGIGKLVILTLLKRAKKIGFEYQHVNEIYDFNLASQKLFTSCGYTVHSKTEKGASYVIHLNHEL